MHSSDTRNPATSSRMESFIIFIFILNGVMKRHVRNINFNTWNMNELYIVTFINIES